MMRHIRRMCYPVAALAILTGPLPLFTVLHADPAQAEPVRPAPRAAPVTCPARVALTNGGFEQPAVTGGPVGFFPDASQSAPNAVPGWRTTAGDHTTELWTGPPNPTTTPPAEGRQFAELNANEVSTLYQDQPTTPGAKLYWRLSHRGRLGVDTMALDIGAPGAPVEQKTMSDGTGAWGTYSGVYTVPEGQTTTRFAFRSVSAAGGNPGIGNFLDDVFFGTAPCVTVAKSGIPLGPYEVGDVLTYRVTAKNEGGGVAENTRLTDPLPLGLTYVPGSLRIVNGPNSGRKTDQPGDDQAEFDPATRTVSFALGSGATGSAAGRLPNTTELPDGTTVEFRVEVNRGGAGERLLNRASVSYENRLGPEPELLVSPSNDVATAVNPAVDLILTKTADLTRVTVGQTITYRLTVRNDGPNNASNAYVEDVLPPGLSVVTWAPMGGLYDLKSGRWTLGGLLRGGSATLTIQAKATAPGKKVNRAVAKNDWKDLNPADNTDGVTVCVDPAPRCTKCASVSCAVCGPQA